MKGGDPSGNRTHNLLIKRYFGLSAVAHRVEVRANQVQLSSEKRVRSWCESEGTWGTLESVSSRRRRASVAAGQLESADARSVHGGNSLTGWRTCGNGCQVAVAVEACRLLPIAELPISIVRQDARLITDRVAGSGNTVAPRVRAGELSLDFDPRAIALWWELEPRSRRRELRSRRDDRLRPDGRSAGSRGRASRRIPSCL